MPSYNSVSRKIGNQKHNSKRCKYFWKKHNICFMRCKCGKKPYPQPEYQHHYECISRQEVIGNDKVEAWIDCMCGRNNNINTPWGNDVSTTSFPLTGNVYIRVYTHIHNGGLVNENSNEGGFLFIMNLKI